jgi:Kef-type K+ transport system membrane component KefB
MTSDVSSAALSYHEPGIVTILIQASFLLLLNCVNYVLDRIVYCGLIGQILIGIAWGTPGSRWLGPESEQVVVQLGYLGLVLLVYEGISTVMVGIIDHAPRSKVFITLLCPHPLGWTSLDSLHFCAYNNLSCVDVLPSMSSQFRPHFSFSFFTLTKLLTGGLSTSFPSLKANLTLSTFIALTGIAIPIALSFTLQGLTGATPLQSFAAGAALCSTSLGTTFTILGTSGLTNTRLGTVLTSAAMMDDVVGLVMVQVISNLGSSKLSFDAVTVVKPVFVSIGFAVVCPLACRLIVGPLTIRLNQYRSKKPSGWICQALTRYETAFVIHTSLLLAMVTASTYAGTSNLFAAYLAGAMVSWWDTEVPHPLVQLARKQQNSDGLEMSGTRDVTAHSDQLNGTSENATSGTTIYQDCYSKPVDRILKPFFFVRDYLGFIYYG